MSLYARFSALLDGILDEPVEDEDDVVIDDVVVMGANGLPVDKYTNYQIMWYVILHMTFVLSAVLLGVLDKMSFAKHREH